MTFHPGAGADERKKQTIERIIPEESSTEKLPNVQTLPGKNALCQSYNNTKRHLQQVQLSSASVTHHTLRNKLHHTAYVTALLLATEAHCFREVFAPATRFRCCNATFAATSLAWFASSNSIPLGVEKRYCCGVIPAAG